MVGVEFDPHCHLTAAMVKSVDIAVFYKEFPHTDFYERAEKLVSLVARTLNKVRRQLNHTYAESYIRHNAMPLP